MKVNSPNFLKPENWNKSIFENLYTIEESVVGEGGPTAPAPSHFRLRQIEDNPSEQVYIKKLFVKEGASFHTEAKKSLRNYDGHRGNKQEKSTATESSQGSQVEDKQHRLNFLMGKLNF